MKYLYACILALLLGAPAQAANMYWQDGVLVLDDVIVRGDAAYMRDMLNNTPAGQLRVHLASRGGDIEESQALGALLRQYNATVTHGYCASACVLTFLGGTTRILGGTDIEDGASLAVHQPLATDAYLRSTNPVMQHAVKQLEDYVRSMTGSLDFYTFMMGIPYEAPRALTRQEAFGLNVVTAEVTAP